MNETKIKEICEYIRNSSETSKIYLGCDSTAYLRNKQRMVDYYWVVVVHINGRNGCRIFGDRMTEPDYSKDKKKPLYRLMTEVQKVAELYMHLEESIGDREVEIHLDLNPSSKHASNLIVDQAIGYIKGTCNVVPLIKPDSWASSHVADKFLRFA